MNPRLTEYNDYYFVYGNSELRFRLNDDKLSNNIGHNYRSFDTGVYRNAEIFTGSNGETAVMESYEFWQVHFENS